MLDQTCLQVFYDLLQTQVSFWSRPVENLFMCLDTASLSMRFPPGEAHLPLMWYFLSFLWARWKPFSPKHPFLFMSTVTFHSPFSSSWLKSLNSLSSLVLFCFSTLNRGSGPRGERRLRPALTLVLYHPTPTYSHVCWALAFRELLVDSHHTVSPSSSKRRCRLFCHLGERTFTMLEPCIIPRTSSLSSSPWEPTHKWKKKTHGKMEMQRFSVSPWHQWVDISVHINLMCLKVWYIWRFLHP